jgi:RsiW-degrading membrane proteinase PrsW (M82 family)
LIAPNCGRHESMLLLAWLDRVVGKLCVTRTNVLYLVIGALAVAVAVLSYQLYQDRHQPEGVHIELGPGGLSIQGQGKGK